MLLLLLLLLAAGASLEATFGPPRDIRITRTFESGNKEYEVASEA
jgi:hypothetical protein